MVDSNLVRVMTKNYAYKNKICPLNSDENYVYIAADEEKSREVYSYCTFIFRKDIKIVIKDEAVLYRLLHMYYGDEELKSIIISNNEENKGSAVITGPNAELSDYVLNHAIDEHVSDIHIEPDNREANIRFRKDGILHTFMNISWEAYKGLIGRIKVMSKMNLTDKRIFQDGRIFYSYNGQEYDVRLSVAPTIYAETIVMRILYKNELIKTLEDLEYSYENLKCLKKLLTLNSGMIIISGPTGSGKSTTLYAALNYINNEKVNICTLEDPVEYNMDGINQIDVNECHDITFNSGLRSILRQDPDVIMIGEIRDEETAHIAVRAAITGHLVLTTLHTNNAIGALTRLIDMNIPRYLLKDALKGLIGQRLVRRLCNECKIKHEISHEEIKFLQGDISEYKQIKVYENSKEGCYKCGYSGYDGRMCISEIIDMTKFDWDLERPMPYKSMKYDFAQKVRSGTTSISEGKRCI